jgi:hypothetical protein
VPPLARRLATVLAGLVVVASALGGSLYVLRGHGVGTSPTGSASQPVPRPAAPAPTPMAELPLPVAPPAATVPPHATVPPPAAVPGTGGHPVTNRPNAPRAHQRYDGRPVTREQRHTDRIETTTSEVDDEDDDEESPEPARRVERAPTPSDLIDMVDTLHTALVGLG